ncbi:MAG TPA: YceI family protein [Aggregatilineales bacterium]|nr:YceI family protein [Anaerolineales bacterium]HRE47128.1 YceI family protein [Aggregatilineales bacterium]
MENILPSKPSGISSKLVRTGIVLAALILIGGLSLFTFVWLSGGSGQPSGDLNTIAPLQLTETQTLFRLVAAESEVRFVIQETLLGMPTTVVGVTNQVAGEIGVDLNSPAKSQLGGIRINVRTLKTDNEIRNRALRGQILHSNEDQYEFAVFTPTKLIGLPETNQVGVLPKFQIEGVLALHGVSHSVTFEAEITTLAAARITGRAVATIAYRDFKVSIPAVAGVANVGETVRLEIDFTAISHAS